MLAVDIGNSFTRVAAFMGDAISFRRSFPTAALDLYELESTYREAAEMTKEASIWIASVAPQVNATAASAAERARLGRTFIKPASDTILPHKLTTPATTGVDRLLAAFAAGKLYFDGAANECGYVVAQCGSAATVDYVDPAGVFRGGYIIPGPGLWLAGLAEAAMLPDLSNAVPDWKRVDLGDNTRDALLNGMHICLPTSVATAVMMIASPDREANPDEPGPPVVLTGGWGEAVTPYLASPFRYDPDLVLHGIRLFAERYV